MSARPTGSATVSFGLVSIPVKLYSATQQAAAVSFNLLHKKCSSRLKQQYLCSSDGEIVPRQDMIKGYEFTKDRYVTFTPEELKQLEEKATETIEISEFIPIDTIDPVYFDKAYYLGPDKGGAKAYTLLAETMARTGRVALARYAARGKQYLVLLRPVPVRPGQVGDGLVMHQLLYADEVRTFADVPLDRVEVREQELKLATQLVEQIASDSFRPEAYEDDVKKRILDAIQRKVEGEEVSLAQPEAPGAQVIDLMEALKASLAGKSAAALAEASDSPAHAGASEAAHGDPERKPARRAPRKSAAASNVFKK